MANTLSLGSRFRTVRLGLAPIAFVAGQTGSVEIPKGLLHKGFVLRLSGALVVGVANAANIFAEAPLGLIKNISIVADGNKTLFTATARDLFRLAHFMRSKQGEISPPVVGVGTNAFSASIALDMEAVRFFSPNDSYFDPRIYEKTQLVIQWGQATDIATAGGGGTIAISATTQVDVQAYQTTEGQGRILFDKIVTFDEKQVVATTPNLIFPVPRAGLLAHALIRADRDLGAGAGPTPVDNLINFVALRSESTVKHMDALAWSTIQRANVVDWQLDGGATAGAQIVGYALLDFTEDGMLSTALNVNALNALDLILDVTRTGNTENIRITYVFFNPRSLPQTLAA